MHMGSSDGKKLLELWELPLVKSEETPSALDWTDNLNAPADLHHNIKC